ncbi:MAG TPA: family 16 glycosylhydrolase [Polyangiaceae bacterium]|nr:family 16 glycosylhydrolase [Polyangiaceae bacterium]
MKQILVAAVGFLATTLLPQLAHAVSSAELYTASAYSYGRVETRLRFAAGDGVVSSFFLWKDGSEQAGMFWNELDFEKLGADCRLETNPIYGKPSANHSQRHALALDLCGVFHDYVYEWTPEAIVWRVDGQEIRRETGATAQAFAENAGQIGMQIHLNLWPGDASFGGNFNPASLPVHQYVDWVQFSEYQDGEFKLAWREEFEGSTLPTGWLTGTWASPKNRSTHASENVSFIDGFAVLSLTADDARGPAGAMPGQVASGGAKSDAGSGTSGGTNGSVGGAGGAVGGSSSASGASSAGVAMPSATSDAEAASCSLGKRSGGGRAGVGFAAVAYLFLRRRRRL